MKNRIGFSLALICCVSLSAVAQDKKALVGGTLINGLGAAPIHDSVILVNGNTIEQVGTVETLVVPEGYEVISTEAMSVLPGLWDMHVHLDINGHADYPHWFPAYRDRFASEIMPASAVQLLLAGVTSARDLGASLEDTLSVKTRLEAGEIHGPRMFWSGPFIQKAPYPGTEDYRWGVDGPKDARAKVKRLADAGMHVIKLIDQDLMTLEEAQAVVDEAHEHGLNVVAHAHRPPEIRRGLEIGIDNFEHTGLSAAPEYPEDVMIMLKERTAASMIVDDPLYWTPTVEGLWNSVEIRDSHEKLDSDCWHRGLEQDTIEDIAASIAHPEDLTYTMLHPKRQKTLKRKIAQLRESGVVLMIGTDSGIPMKFHCQSTWNELDVWVRVMGIPAMEAIQAATFWPAKFMGVDDSWGTVTRGKFADIIAVKGDVLKYINLLQDVDFVMKDGVVYKQGGIVSEAALQ
ncbi:MAG: amidohydrolase family protein [Xanthomonadales bacterium]|nr:amidohydrolase family protein [Gammaproteobacteria bacterium]NNE04839.1 amidohydrolase family protein [Xanthomonadales bacterium]NNL95088.1 amidohydrolase family protein [Xanthomonadales bacterium]